MLSVISPSKNLDFKSDAKSRKKTTPLFLDDASHLIDNMRDLSGGEIQNLMSINQDLVELNKERYQTWNTDFKGARQALLAFKGGVYFGLEAWNFSEGDLTSAQRRLRILSGLYGMLRPLDLIHPYRLEMGLPIKTGEFDDLYAYWGSRISEELNKQLEEHRNPVLVNLASDEYFKVIDQEKLNYPVVQCRFLDKFRGKYRFMSFYGKKARGLMAKHIILNKIDNVAGLKRFDLEGYRYDKSLSKKESLAFVRDEVPQSS